MEQGGQSIWCFCIDYVDATGNAASSGAGSGSRQRIDYKELLQPDEFAVFAQLRDWRKEIAQREAIPVYTIFTNEQMAQMVQTRASSLAELKKIEGIGDARRINMRPRSWHCSASIGRQRLTLRTDPATALVPTLCVVTHGWDAPRPVQSKTSMVPPLRSWKA